MLSKIENFLFKFVGGSLIFMSVVYLIGAVFEPELRPNVGPLIFAVVLIGFGLFLWKKSNPHASVGDVPKHPELITEQENSTIETVEVVNHKDFVKSDDIFVVLDFETTGLSPTEDRIVEVAALKYSGDELVEELSTLINPGIKIPSRVTEIHGISNHMVKKAPKIEHTLPYLVDFISSYPVVGHNVSFDIGFLNASLNRSGLPPISNQVVDTLQLSRRMYPNLPNHKLGTVASHIGANTDNLHRSTSDCMATAQIYLDYRNRQEIEKNKRIEYLDDMEKQLFDSIKTLLEDNERDIGRLDVSRTSKYFDIKYGYPFIRTKLGGKKKYILTHMPESKFLDNYGPIIDIEPAVASENGKTRLLFNDLDELDVIHPFILDEYERTKSEYLEHQAYRENREYSSTLPGGITVTIK